MFLWKPDKQHLSSSSDARSSLPIPMIYEQLPSQALNWEYHVLSLDPSETELPAIEQLNALGREGWVLVSLLDERASGRGKKVYYYFTRQAQPAE